MPAQAHGQLQELAATLGLPGLLLGSAVGALGLAGLLRRRKRPSPALAGAAVGTACVLAHAQVDWHWQVPAVALPVVALLACGAALHPLGAADPAPRRAHRRRQSCSPLALLWVLPGFASERLIERAVAQRRPGRRAPAATLSPVRPGAPAPRRRTWSPGSRPSQRRPRGDAPRARRSGARWSLVAQLAGKDTALRSQSLRESKARKPAPHQLHLSARTGSDPHDPGLTPGMPDLTPQRTRAADAFRRQIGPAR